MPDLNDLERTKAQVLSRKMIVEQLERGVPGAAAALATVGDLPAGMRLVSLETHGDTLALRVGGGTPETRLALIERVSAHGWRSVRVSPATADDAQGIVQLDARWPREAAP